MRNRCFRCFTGLFVSVVVLLAACGGGDNAPAPAGSGQSSSSSSSAASSSSLSSSSTSSSSASSSSASSSSSGQVQFGLDTRPSNTTCVAPDRAIGGTVSTPRAFTNLSFSRPILMLQAPGDSSRWYVVEQSGRIRVFNNSPTVASSSLALDISLNVASNGELGLLGMAFHPQFASNHFIYLFYSRNNTSPRQSWISRFTSNDNGATFDSSSELKLLQINKPFDNHNGGHIAFGPDGYLYIGVGDGGDGNDPNNYAQNLTRLLGKMLRIDVNGSPYGIPSDNPYVGNALCNTDGTGAASCPEIYAYGLRNPWRWSFDANNSGDLWLGDVGQGAYEEVDRITKGGNFGWVCREGAHTNPNLNSTRLASCPAASTMIDPVNEYGRSLGSSITGGYRYRGTTMPTYVGKYLFADFNSGRIWALTQNGAEWDRSDVISTGLNISSFAQSNSNELYFLSYSDGQIRALQTGTGNGTPMPTSLSQTGCVMSGQATQPAAGLIPFAPRSPLWSDGAAKTRWIGVPNGNTINIDTDGDFDFPNGTVLMKNFALNNLLVETRLFMKHPDGVWAGYSYEWNDAQTDATLVSVDGKTKTVGSQTWSYPSQSQCLQCHTPGAGFSLGAEVAQMNHAMLYPQTNRTANQMDTLAQIGMFTFTPPWILAYPDPYGTDTASNRARSYLHSNCSGCHRPGTGVPSNMDLRYSTTLMQTNACNAMPQNGDLGIANARIITPGNAAASVLVSRMNRRPPDMNGMPLVGTNVVDTAAVALMTTWINGLTSCN